MSAIKLLEEAREMLQSAHVATSLVWPRKDLCARIDALLNTGGWIAAELAMHEVANAVAKFPTWPTDPLHAVAVLGEEFGELTKAALQLAYEPHKTSVDEFRTEAIQTAAMALRFLQSIDAYQFKRGEQHTQQPLPPLPEAT